MDPKVVDPKPISARPTMMVQKLTPKQMLERRRKGLCYYCDESWTMWHTCKAMKLYVIEEVQEEEGACVTSDEEEEGKKWCEERGNTHNFIDKTLALSLKFQVDTSNKCGVGVANGQVIKTKGECKEMKFKMQGLHLKTNLKVLNLGGYALVLGTQWLSTLGVKRWDFDKLLIGFRNEGRQLWLQGIEASKSLIQEGKNYQARIALKGLLV